MRGTHQHQRIRQWVKMSRHNPYLYGAEASVLRMHFCHPLLRSKFQKPWRRPVPTELVGSPSNPNGSVPDKGTVFTVKATMDFEAFSHRQPLGVVMVHEGVGGKIRKNVSPRKIACWPMHAARQGQLPSRRQSHRLCDHSTMSLASARNRWAILGI